MEKDTSVAVADDGRGRESGSSSSWSGPGAHAPIVSDELLKQQQQQQQQIHAAPSAASQQEDHTQYNRIPGLQTWRRTMILICLYTGIFLSIMDTSIMATAIYTIALDFNSLAKAFWAILAYQLAYLGFAVVFARISDFTGRRAAILSAFTLFIAFSLGCGWSRNINELIAFRTLQGVGGAGIYAVSVILIVETSTPKLMALTSSFIGATIAMSGVLGPVLGGVFTQYASWRWIFWINGPCGAVAVLCFLLGWPHSTTAYNSSKRKFAEFDWPGAILLLAASLLVVFGLQEAGTGSYAWNSPLILATLITGCLCWLLLLAWEYYVHVKHRDSVASILPFTILTRRPLVAGIISTMLTGFSYLLVIVSLPLRFQIVNQRTPASAGVHLLPLLCALGFGSFLGGFVSRKRNRIWQTFVVGSAIILLAAGLLSTLGNGEAIQARCYGFQIIAGVGIGFTFASVSIMCAISTDRRTHSVAQGLAAQLRLFGGSIGIAASNAIFNKTCNAHLVGILTPEQIRSLQTNTRIISTLDAVSKQAVRLAYAESFRTSLRVCTYIAAVGLVASAFTWEKNPPMVQAQVMAEMMRKRALAQAHAQAQAQAETAGPHNGSNVIEERLEGKI